MPQPTTLFVGLDAHQESLACLIQARSPDTLAEAAYGRRDQQDRCTAHVARAATPSSRRMSGLRLPLDSVASIGC